MALAAPDFFAGSHNPQQGAVNVFNSAGWIRRRCNEIAAEAELDMFKALDLAANCLGFRTEMEKFRDGAGDLREIRAALIAETRARAPGNPVKTAAEVNDDYKALYAATGVYLGWAGVNLPGAGQPVTGATVTVNRPWPSPDITVRVAKTVAVINAVAALRGVID